MSAPCIRVGRLTGSSTSSRLRSLTQWRTLLRASSAHERNGAPDFRRGEGFGQSWHTALRKEGRDLGAQGIAREENKAPAQRRRALLQRPVETWPIQLWHAQITQDQVIGALLKLLQGQPAIGRRVDRMAIATQ